MEQGVASFYTKQGFLTTFGDNQCDENWLVNQQSKVAENPKEASALLSHANSPNLQ